jgi:hypothetical protein
MPYALLSATLATHALQLKSTWVLFAFNCFFTPAGSNALMCFWACHVVSLQMNEGLFSFLNSMAEADVLCVAA